MSFKKLSISDSCDDSFFERCSLTLSHLINEFLVFSEDRTGLVFLEATLSSSIISYKTVLSVEYIELVFKALLNLILLNFFKPISSIIRAV